MTSANGATGASSGEGAQPSRRAAIFTARLGVIQAVLMLVSYGLLTRIPGPRAPDAEFVEFYESDRRRLVVVVGLYLLPFAAIAFLWFAVALRMWLARTAHAEDALLSHIQLVSAIIFIALFLVGAAASTVLAVSVEFADYPVDPGAARQFPQFGSALVLVFAMRMAAMFVFATSGIARRRAALPRWFIWAGYLVGLFLLLSATLSRLLVLVFPVWVLILSLILLFKARRLPADDGNAHLEGQGTAPS
jgi:hypothetical protein